jgi:hypothetical protein
MEKRKEWPSSPRALSGRVRRAAGTLRKVGIEVTFDREPGGKRRTITIANLSPPPQFVSQPSQPSQRNDVNGLGRDANCDAKSEAAVCVTPTVTANPLKSQACDGRDDRDAKIPTPTEPWLTQARVRELARWHIDQAADEMQREGGGDVDLTELAIGLRQVLAEEVPPELVEQEFERVMAEVFRV